MIAPVVGRLRTAAASAATGALGRAGVAGLHDLGGMGTLFVPALRGGALRVESLLGESALDGTLRYLHEPPRSLAPDPAMQQVFDPRPLPRVSSRCYTFEEARLIGEEGILVEPRTGRVYWESAGRLERARKSVRSRAKLLAPACRVDGPLVFLPTYGSANYFQFLMDVLTRLYAFAPEGDDSAAGFRVSVSATEFVLDAREPAWQRQLVDLLDLPARYEVLSPRTNWVVSPLVFPTFVGIAHGDHATLYPPRAVRWLRSVLVEAAGATAPGPRRRLYLSRSGTEWRRLMNEDVLVDRLAVYGFECVAPERLSIVEQIRLFANAELVVGAHGSALTNILFAAVCKVIEIVAPFYPSAAFYSLAEALGHEYWYVFGERSRLSPLDLEVHVDDVARTVEAALGRRETSLA